MHLQKKRLRNKRFSQPPVLTIESINARNDIQKSKLDELLLSHVDTLTQHSGSRTKLPVLSPQNNNNSGPHTLKANTHRLGAHRTTTQIVKPSGQAVLDKPFATFTAQREIDTDQGGVVGRYTKGQGGFRQKQIQNISRRVGSFSLNQRNADKIITLDS